MPGEPYRLVLAKAAAKDRDKIRQNPALKRKVEQLLAILAVNPFQTPPPYEKLVGDLSGLYSRRINVQHRLVYQVCEEQRVVKILSLWTHYER